MSGVTLRTEAVKGMNEFKNYHPLVNFAYFTAVIAFAMFFMNPFCLAVSFLSGFLYSVMLGGRKALKSFLMYLVPLMLITALINPAFSHAGITVLGYLPSGNPLTLESVLYGIAASFMLAGVLCWFSCFNKIITSDKIMYLFGKILPSLSLIISMTLRFVPKFRQQLKEVRDAQRCIGRDLSDGKIIKKIKNSIRILSVVITQSLENAIDTADSMKSRGCGLPGRTAYSNYTFDNRDKAALAAVLALTAYVLAGGIFGKFHFSFFPYIKSSEVTPYGLSFFAAYAVLCFMPVIIEIREEHRWKKLRSKI